MILFKIALRNLREHATKTLIIGTLIALGVAVLVTGNSVTTSITRGLEASYVESFTGDLIVRAPSDDDVAFVGGLGAVPPVLDDVAALGAVLDADEGVVAWTPLLSGAAGVGVDDASLSFALLWGIEPSSYLAMFPDSFVLTDGRFLEDGEVGILLSQAVVDAIADEHDLRLEVGDRILLRGQNDATGTKIREVPIRGIGAFASAAGPLERLSLVDATTLRALAGLTALRSRDAALEAPAPDTSEAALFGRSSDASFGGAFVREADPTDAEVDYDTLLGDTSVRDAYLALDNAAWHFVVLDVADGASAAGVTQRLGASEVGETVRVEGWRWGAGVVADLAFSLRTVVNWVILVVAVVAVIVIMNTLVISVTERMAEIGTIRAIGGQKGFVRRMITVEVLTITLLFGVVGMALGGLLIGVLNLIGLAPANLFLQILFGGSVLRPTLSLAALGASLLVVLVVGVVASLYPVSVALGVPPVRAMQNR